MSNGIVIYLPTFVFGIRLVDRVYGFRGLEAQSPEDYIITFPIPTTSAPARIAVIPTFAVGVNPAPKRNGSIAGKNGFHRMHGTRNI